MPTAAPTAPAAPAAVVPPSSQPTPNASPTTTPQTAPAAAPAATQAQEPPKRIGSKIWQNLIDAESGKQPEEKPKEAAAPAKTEVKPEPTQTAPTAPDKPIKATKRAAITKRPELPKEATSTPASVAPAPAQPELEPDLLEEEKQFLADAEEAEKHLPEVKGIAEKTKKFIREHQKYLEKHPEIDGDPEAEAAYEKWLTTNRPTLNEKQQRTLVERRIAEQVGKPLHEETAKLKHELFVRDREPVIQNEGRQKMTELYNTVIPDEITAFAKQHGNEAAKKEFADEINLVSAVVNVAVADYQELLRLSEKDPRTGRPMAEPVISLNDPRYTPEVARQKYDQHERLAGIISRVNEDFRNNAPQAQLVRDGKWFCTRDEWNAGYSKHPDKFWTFDNKEIAQRAMSWIKPAIEGRIKQYREEMTARGWQRRPLATPPAVAPTPTSSPAPSPSPVPSLSPNNGGAPQTRGARLASNLNKA